ncbi:hypothetical protein M231_07664 [Tremella mesenterica]|uniref:Nucleolus and neural progenitor protein-like N-terminal domain-containing protein n=1 Tax=Tremella mesenterica TaxID=5217 RepID=A0A4Q1BAN1_TREME|nr:uncharacterized protein TREMEDRAFT_59361 [Tremella mesenterica DSM 1558]EIW73199.1 hypothetical protein TREMEDRAFT_59361 [Tremella mesenterica DSM 1558]RXK35077.1 hypothetical protein M231_07664 [Tremella mesenterica]
MSEMDFRKISKEFPPSILTLLQTEYILLDTLIRKSKDQHKSQIFFSRLLAVRRYSKLVLYSLLDRLPSQTSSSSTLKQDQHLPSRVSPNNIYHVASPFGTPDKRSDDKISKDLQHLKILIDKLIQALFTATQSSQQIVQLRYFLPLHTVLISMYARLFTICTSIDIWLSPQLLTNIPTTEVDRKSQVMEVETYTDLGVQDVGEKIERQVSSSINVVPLSKMIRTEADRKEEKETVIDTIMVGERPFSNDLTEDNHQTNVQVQIKEAVGSPSMKSTTKKKRKRDVMDDIFGF